jgi:hypothetical protein
MKCYRLAVAVALALGVARASAQTSSEGSIRGYVRDEQGGVLAGVSLTASSTTAPGTHTAVTDSAGYYRLVDLPPGTYSIAAEREGFARLVREGIVVRAGLNLGTNLVMKVGAITETVEVKAETPMLDSRTAARTVNISGDFQRSLPIAARRNWSDFMELVPGLTTSQQAAEFYFVRGANLDAHVIRLDGVSIDSGFQGGNTFIKLNTDALQDVQVKTAGADAAAPLGLGAIIDVATPSGANELHGAVTVAYQGESWNDRNTTGTVAATRQLQTDLSLGGPIRRDVAWFFAAYRYHDRRRGVNRTPAELGRLAALAPGFEPIDSENRAHFAFAKATVRVGRRHRAYAWYEYDRNPDNLVGPTDAALFVERPSGGGAAAVRLSSIWGSTLGTQVLASYTNKRFDQIVLDHDRPGRAVYQNSFLSGGRRTGNTQVALLDNRNFPEQRTDYPKLSLAFDATHHRQGGLASHELQAGVYLQRIGGLLEQGYFNNGFILEDVVLNNPSDVSAGMRAFHRRIYDQTTLEEFRGRSLNVAFYVQDAWRPSARLTLTPGLRVDLIRQNDDLFGIETVSSTEIGPRIGVNYQLTSNGRNAVTASWARISDSLPRTRLSVGSTAASFRDLYDNDLDGSFETVFVTPGSTTRNPNQRFDPDYHQPFVKEWTLGYRRQFGGQVAVNVTFAHREYRDRPASVEVNGIYDGGVFRGYRDESLNDILLRTNNRYNWPVYSGLELEASKQVSRLQMLVSYTRQWRHLAGTWQPNDPASFLQPDAFPNDKGIGATHSTDNSILGASRANWRDHVGKVALAYQGPWGLRLATHYVYQSGQWSSPILMQLPAADPRFGPPTVQLSNGRVVSNPLATPIRFAFPTRGEGQFTAPDVQLWNLRVGREFSLGPTRLMADLDVFNVTNRGDFELLQSGAHQLYSPNYRLGQAVQPPRSAQLTLRFTY